MNWAKKLVLAAGLTVLGGATAFGDYARGYFNNWANDCSLTHTGNYYAGTLLAHPGQDAGLKFDNDGNWGGNIWGAGTSATVNGTIGSASKGASGNLAMDVTDGYYYTFHLAGDYDWGDRSYLVMKTKYAPASFLSVTNDHATAFESNVTVTANCSAGTAVEISPEETLYIQYTTDDWATKHLVAMTGSGLTRRGTIPGQTAGTTVKYIVFSSTMPSNLFTDAVIYSSPANLDQLGFCMLAVADGGTPSSYTTAAEQTERVPGNVWHCPGNYEPFDSATMRDPLAVSAGDTPYIRLGSYPRVDSGSTDAPDLVKLWYRVNSGTWYGRTMKTATTSQDYANNDYFTNSLPTDKMVEGNVIEYIFEAAYANSGTLATTYVGTTNQTASVTYTNMDTAKAHPFTFTVGAAPVVEPDLGNCWHIPGQFEPWPGATMRNPLYPSSGQTVTFFVGNQYAGDGKPGNVTSWNLHYRTNSESAWTSVAMTWEDAAETAWNKYGKAVLDGGLPSGVTEYYFELNYSDRDTTWLGAAATGTRGQTFASEAEAQASAFQCDVSGEAGQEPGYVWHAGNAVVAGTNAVQFWVKIGYAGWATNVELRYNFKSGRVPSSATRSGRTAKRAVARSLSNYSTASFAADHEEEDSSGYGNAQWWVCTLTSDEFTDAAKYLEYEIVATGSNGVPRRADYHTSSAATLFYYTMFQAGSGALTVNGLNADYTTSKFFIDEAAGETVTLEVVYAPQVSSPYAVEIFSNVGRRDFWNADIDGNGVADAIRPPSGDLITADITNAYFAAIPMEWDSTAHAYKKTLEVGKCGAYRLTARYKETASDSWHYYSELGSGIRDHAIMVSPKKVLQQRVYEVNGMTAKASAPTQAGHSTFADLIEGEDSFAEFGIPYLNKIQANCLWFQPIHTSSEYGLAEGGEPGSPYAAKDYFSVSKWYGKAGTTAGALSEFQDFVAACDAGKSPSMSTSYVGTINIMLDGVFNHTSWDAVFGVMGEQLGIVPAGTGASTAIASVKPGWYANCSDYGAPATWYNGPGWGNHDIACGPDRGDFGKWEDTAELFYGRYSALVRHNPDNNGDYLNEDDQYDYTSMSEDTELLWDYMGSYVPYWLEKTGHDFGNELTGQLDANGVAYDDYGIDGLRCDFGQGLPPQFWEYCINRARSKKWNFMFMAESLDGGKVSYRSNRHFDILNESFVFAARNAGNPSELLAVTDDKKAAYNGGAVLLNLTSHDEVMPYSDPWKTASRYAMLATVKGLPMTFYGQEQGIIPCDWGSDWAGEGTIIQPGNASFGFSKFELNFGKWVADFKTWNKMTIWDEPPMGAEASHGMAQLYGHVNWARASSPALQSDVQWMLDRVEGYRSTDVWAMAKAEEYGALANGKDAVLAFVLFVNDTHYATQQTFAIPAGAAAMLGLEAGESYTARNLASGNAEQVLWTKTTEELTGEGVWVNFTADQGTAFYDDGAMVQFLKLEKAVPVVTHDITVTIGANGTVSPDGTVTVDDGEDQAFVITADAGYRIASVLADGVAVGTFDNSSTNWTYTWENVTADGTLAVAFTPRVWTITASAGPNGSVSPSGAVSVNDGASQAFAVAADTGYRILSVLVDGASVGSFDNDSTSWSYTWQNIAADGTFAASFIEQTSASTTVVSTNGVPVETSWLDTVYPDGWTDSIVNENGANGIPVWASYVAGLDPTDADSKLECGDGLAIADNVVTFSVDIPAGRVATVQYIDDLVSETGWLDGASWPAGAERTETFTDDGLNARRFYRVKIALPTE